MRLARGVHAKVGSAVSGTHTHVSDTSVGTLLCSVDHIPLQFPLHSMHTI
jgi:hypothetical protein